MTITEESKARAGAEWIGKIIADRYEVVRVLGHGGMGSVFLAEDLLNTRHEVAIKILHAELIDDDVQKQRFIREIELIRRVNHKNVVRLFDVGVRDKLFFYVMEYLPGRSLEQIIDKRSLPSSQVPNLIIQICSGLSAIHRSNIIHRDLKPANIVVQADGSVKITDFGIARPENSELTKHNEIIGSVLYIAPENWLGKELTGSVDLYAFGIILYELITGQLPFQADTAAKLMRLHLDAAPIPPKELQPSIPPWLNKLVLRLLAKSPLDRPRTADEVIDEVRSRAAIKSDDESEKQLAQSSASFLESLEQQWSSSVQPAVTNPQAISHTEPTASLSTSTPSAPSLLEKAKGFFKRR